MTVETDNSDDWENAKDDAPRKQKKPANGLFVICDLYLKAMAAQDQACAAASNRLS